MTESNPHGEPETMTVTVRDRSAEAPWGYGPTNPVIRDITISAFCPIDGERRGVPAKQRYHDDGVDYWVDNWQNPCGHTDLYADVINEARAMAIDEAEASRG